MIFLLSVSPSMENEQKLQYFTNFISQMHIYNSMLMIWWVPSTFWALNFDICTSDNNSNRMRCIMTWIVKRMGIRLKILKMWNTRGLKQTNIKGMLTAMCSHFSAFYIFIFLFDCIQFVLFFILIYFATNLVSVISILLKLF